MKILIADCGSTSARWALHDTLQPGELTVITTSGFNASALDTDAIAALIAPVAQMARMADEIRFYGAGCRAGEPSERVAAAFATIAPDARITVAADIYAAIHALAPADTAIVAILGTGVNAVVASQGEIIDAVPSTGYILGDYGSGASMGRTLMGLYVSGRLPLDLQRSLESDHGITVAAVIDSVYRGAAPRAFLGSFAPYILSHDAHPLIAKLIEDEFTKFVNVSLRPLYERHKADIRLSGSIAAHFRHHISAAISASLPGARLSAVTANPIDCIRP